MSMKTMQQGGAAVTRQQLQFLQRRQHFDATVGARERIAVADGAFDRGAQRIDLQAQPRTGRDEVLEIDAIDRGFGASRAQQPRGDLVQTLVLLAHGREGRAGREVHSARGHRTSARTDTCDAPTARGQRGRWDARRKSSATGSRASASAPRRLPAVAPRRGAKSTDPSCPWVYSVSRPSQTTAACGTATSPAQLDLSESVRWLASLHACRTAHRAQCPFGLQTRPGNASKTQPSVPTIGRIRAPGRRPREG